ncbi:MAG: DUF2393 domain-containing protein [Bryobacteraceae bacterium]|nr:DUF2393 domain-containing protein [Bryobacteraceae bacterium]
MASKSQSRAVSPKAIVGIGAVLAVMGLVWFLNRPVPPPQPEPLTPEAKAYVRNLRLSEVTMKATKSYLTQMITEIEGKITNAGDRGLQGIELNCAFYDAYSQLVLRERVTIVRGGLKPGETKSFRLPFDAIPQSWNQQMPQLVIAGIRFEP